MLADFPGGSVEDMWSSTQKLLALPDSMRLFVGHDYPPQDKSRAFRWETSVAEQKASNKMVKAGTKMVRARVCLLWCRPLVVGLLALLIKQRLCVCVLCLCRPPVRRKSSLRSARRATRR
jgi:glyoxylase-like metal-dependent hydrolase (beta-lactamase superfamily II)